MILVFTNEIILKRSRISPVVKSVGQSKDQPVSGETTDSTLLHPYISQHKAWYVNRTSQTMLMGFIQKCDFSSLTIKKVVKGFNMMDK